MKFNEQTHKIKFRCTISNQPNLYDSVYFSESFKVWYSLKNWVHQESERCRVAFPVITRSEQALNALCFNSQYLVELTYKTLDCFFNISQRKNLCLLWHLLTLGIIATQGSACFNTLLKLHEVKHSNPRCYIFMAATLHQMEILWMFCARLPRNSVWHTVSLIATGISNQFCGLE